MSQQHLNASQSVDVDVDVGKVLKIAEHLMLLKNSKELIKHALTNYGENINYNEIDEKLNRVYKIVTKHLIDAMKLKSEHHH